MGLREGKEVYVSYLPLAHVLAMQCENAMLALGSKICYSDARQLPTVQNDDLFAASLLFIIRYFSLFLFTSLHSSLFLFASG